MTTARIAFDAMFDLARTMIDHEQTMMDTAQDDTQYGMAYGKWSAWKSMYDRMTELKGDGFEPDSGILLLTLQGGGGQW